MLMLALEGGFVTLVGVGIGVSATVAVILVGRPWIQARFGIALSASAPTPEQWGLLGAVMAAGFLASLVPGWRAYRLSLADGLSPRT